MYVVPVQSVRLLSRDSAGTHIQSYVDTERVTFGDGEVRQIFCRVNGSYPAPRVRVFAAEQDITDHFTAATQRITVGPSATRGLQVRPPRLRIGSIISGCLCDNNLICFAFAPIGHITGLTLHPSVRPPSVCPHGLLIRKTKKPRKKQRWLQVYGILKRTVLHDVFSVWWLVKELWKSVNIWCSYECMKFRGLLFVLTCTCRLMGRQPLAQTSISPAVYLSYEFLNMFTDVARTTLAGSLFQMLTTRWLKKNFLMSSLDLVLVSFLSCPLRA